MTPDVLHELALLRDLGFTHLDLRNAVAPQVTQQSLPASHPATQQLSNPATLLTATIPAATHPPTPQPRDPVTPWHALTSEAHNCTKCRLAGTRTNVVFGVGNPSADLMFIGEAPGRDEDERGEPFVGRAGQLLTDIIKAMKLTRDDVYIANVIKCRPPENRNPEPDELDACRPFIQRQVEIIKPKVIVALGRFGLQSLTEKAYGITAVRGTWLDYNGIKLLPTYHPAYLLRNPASKKDVWADMKKVMAELGIAF
ncbi:MAG TPA: uracil-DNA glycosylase [Thermoanaerobaculia bacterium]|nr:uracil-DNA glycosylase [Thermoanaerobaculia bacterium]